MFSIIILIENITTIKIYTTLQRFHIPPFLHPLQNLVKGAKTNLLVSAIRIYRRRNIFSISHNAQAFCNIFGMHLENHNGHILRLQSRTFGPSLNQRTKFRSKSYPQTITVCLCHTPIIAHQAPFYNIITHEPIIPNNKILNN